MIDILSRWNRWGDAILPSGFTREVLTEIIPFVETTDIVALTGPRRAGKTTVMFQIMDLLQEKGISKQAMLHVNFEEPSLALELGIKLLDELYDIYRAKIYPEGKAYLFFDEIQNVLEWQRWVRARNSTENIKIFITGSSAKLMSRELGTVLTGRHISFNVFPVNFREFLYFNDIVMPESLLTDKAKPKIINALDQFLMWGGFPEVVLAENDQRREYLLKHYFEDILFKDIVMRHSIRDAVTLRNLAVHLLTNTANLISHRRLAAQFAVSPDLIRAYAQYLQESFLLEFLPYFSVKVAERNRHPQKIHAVDLGLRNVVSMAHSIDRGRLLETAIFHVLQQRKQDGIFYWKGKQEINFVIRQGNKVVEAIQVVTDGLENKKIAQREAGALNLVKTIFPDAKHTLIAEKIPSEFESPVIPFWQYLLFHIHP